MQSVFELKDSKDNTALADPDDARFDLPVRVIEPERGWKLINGRELWRHRELLFFFTWRDIKVRYRETVLGAAWAVIKPMATMIAFSLFFGQMVKAEGGQDIPYPLYVYAGLLPWFFFSGAINSASSSVVNSQHLLTKVYFPRLLLPISAVGEGLVDFAIGFVMLLLLMAYYQAPTSWAILAVPLIVLLLMITALGMGILLSALGVVYRDVNHVVPFMMQLWMFMTPTIYLRTNLVVGEQTEAWLPLNPAYGLISNFRHATLTGTINWNALAISGSIGVGLLVVGCLYFRRMERVFPDII